MAYVDLNPIRAGIASTPEESEFTSIYERIREVTTGRAAEQDGGESNCRVPLFGLEAYLGLVDWTTRAIASGKRGFIADHVPPIMTRLNVDPEAWAIAMRPQGNVFGRAMGKLDHLRLHSKTLGQSWVRGLHQAERLYCR
jgi:hypothetical protein